MCLSDGFYKQCINGWLSVQMKNVLSKSIFSKYFTIGYEPRNSKTYIEYLRSLSVSVFEKYPSTSFPLSTCCSWMASIAVPEAFARKVKGTL